MYTYTWKKYLPVLRILLKKSAIGEQTMTLNRTDFEQSSRTRKPSISFSIELKSGRPTTVSPPTQVRDLLEILMQDDIAKNLLRQYQYHIRLDNNFQLTIRNLTPQNEPAVEGSAAE